MGELVLPLASAAAGPQLAYAAWFADERLRAVELRDGALVVT